MKKRIYLVEDDEVLSEGLVLLLRDEGYDVTSFTDASEMAVSNDDPPDCYILDYWLPEDDGMRIAQRLRQNKKTKNIPIVMISASQAALQSGENLSSIDAFFAKPFPIRSFLSAIKHLTG